jgi:excisionase family DNA binding protein
MRSSMDIAKVYTPEQVASLLQLSKNTVYDLINRGEIVAKKLGKVYRIPASSLSFIFTGLDFDLYQAEEVDKKNISEVTKALKAVRKK